MNKFTLKQKKQMNVSVSPAEFQAQLFEDMNALQDALESFNQTFKDYEGCEALLDNIDDLRGMIKANVPFDTVNKIYDLQNGLEVTLEEFNSLDAKKVEATLEGNEKSIWQKIIDFIKDLFNRIKVAVLRFFDVGDKLYKKLLGILDSIKDKKATVEFIQKDSYSIAPFDDIDVAYNSAAWCKGSAFMELVIGTIGVVHAKAYTGAHDDDYYGGMTHHVQKFCDSMNKRRAGTASWNAESGTFEFDSTKLIDVKQYKTLEEAGYDIKKIVVQIQGVVGAYISWTKSIKENVENAKVKAWPTFLSKLINDKMDKATGVEDNQRLKSLIRCANSILGKTNNEMVKIEGKLIKTMSCLVSSIKVTEPSK